jgi:exosortase E/protease (VPEID-CTERM system)
VSDISLASASSVSVSAWPGLLPRLFALALLFSIELVVLSIWLDGSALAGRAGLAGFASLWGAWILRAIIAFAALFATFTWLGNREALTRLSAALASAPIDWKLLAAHAAAMTLFVSLSSRIYSTGLPSDGIVATWFLAGVSAIALAGLSALPAFAWRRLFGGDPYLWAYAVAAVILACVAGNQFRALWLPASRLTFDLTKAILQLFVSRVVADPAGMNLGTQRFSVTIAPECSGFEGVGLIAAFGIVWLVVFRKQCRWPHALLLIPAGVALIFLLNAVRLAALILIGNSGAERIALGGFHSQAGWIAFSAVALGFSVAAREFSWFNRETFNRETFNRQTPQSRSIEVTPTTRNATTEWVLPFVAIVAAGMLSTALSGGFEWLYPLRFLTGAAALWFFRRRYQALDWRFGWQAPAAGALVFVLWIARELFTGVANTGMPAPLAASSFEVRNAWLAARILGAVITVPVAEELAFRGFLMRRLISADFEAVSFQRFSWFALLISSCLFGMLHGARWIEGAAAGVVYGLILLRRGHIGEAVVAHATTNALVAIFVLGFHQWQLW